MNKCILMIFSFCILSPAIFAQDIEPEVFIRTKNTKKIELPEANRNFEKINYELPKVTPKPQEYKTEDVEIVLPKLSTKINVVTIKPGTIAKLYGNYVKAGFGNYSTPYLEAFFNNKRSEKYVYGIHLKHLSSAKGPVRFSGLSQNRADAYVKYFGKGFDINSGISYMRDRYNFYGFNKNIPVENDDTLKHVFNTTSFNIGIKSSGNKSRLLYDADFTYFNFRDNLKAKEDEYLTSFSSSFKLDDEKSLAADAVLSISKRTDSAITINRNYFLLRPAFIYQFGKYKLTAGINAAYTNDTANSGLHLYPRINIDALIKENLLTLFGGIDGEMQKNTLRSFTYQNPYLQSNVPLLHSNKTLELYAGAKGNYEGLNYKARVAYMTYKNLYFFNNSLTDSSKFNVLYDGNTTLTNFGVDLSYDVAESFRIGLNTNYYSYNVGSLEKSFHRPSFISSLLATYNLQKKIYFNMDIYYISGLTGKNYISAKEVKLDGIFDVNLKVDYKFSSAFSAFLELNNILSKKYQRYLYYPVKGINVLGGISYSF